MNACFSGIIHEAQQLQAKLLDFIKKEEAVTLDKLTSSLQQSDSRLLKLEGDSIWLHTLLTNCSDEQFLQARPAPAPPTPYPDPALPNWAPGQPDSTPPPTDAQICPNLG